MNPTTITHAQFDAFELVRKSGMVSNMYSAAEVAELIYEIHNVEITTREVTHLVHHYKELKIKYGRPDEILRGEDL